MAQTWVSRAGFMAVGAAGTAAAADPKYADLIKSWLPSTGEALLAVLRPVAQAAPAAASAAGESVAQAIARSEAVSAASLVAIEQLLKAQRGTTLWRMALLVAAPTVAFAVVYKYGWERVGWVTAEKLQLGLQGVRDAAIAAVNSLGERLTAAVSRVEVRVEATAAAVEESRLEMKAEVQCVAQSVNALEQRLHPIEADVHRTAHGVDVLCRLVATSGLLNNASPASLQALDDFTRTAEALPEPLPQAATPALMSAPPALVAPQPAATVAQQQPADATSSLERAAPLFLRAALAQ